MEFTGERFIPENSDEQIKIEHLQRYYSILDIIKDKVVLDAACGEGYGTFQLASTAAQAIGIDISEETIQHASATYASSNLKYMQASIDKLPVGSNTIEVVVSFETIEHVDEITQQNFMREVKRVLVPGGLLIISTPNKKIYSDARDYKNPYHIKEFYKKEFVDFLEASFSNVKIFHQKNEVASVITNLSSDKEVTQTSEMNEQAPEEGTYFIAMCSDNQLDNTNIGSSLLFANKYSEMMDRILQLQKEVDDRNNHIQYLDEQINAYNLQIEKSSKDSLESIKKLESQNQSSTETIKQLKQTIIQFEDKIGQLNSDISRLTNELQQTQEVSKERSYHIEHLLERERILNNIYTSTGWKVLNRYYGMRDWLLPSNSKRRVFVRLALTSIKHPKKMWRNINKTNIRKLRYYLKVEPASNIENRLNDYMDRHTETNGKEIVVFGQDQIKELLVFPKSEPEVSIIIPVFNQWEYTYSCLKSILTNSGDTKYEIIIADDMSTDDTVNISQYAENINVIRDGINRGFLLNCNHAAKHARAKYLLFLNNDTNVQPNWLSPLIDLMESSDRVGMVGSKLVYADGKLQEAGGIIWNDASGWNYGRLDDPQKPDYNYVKEVDYISGAAIMIRSELWQQIGGFDERYVPAYFEDSDLAFEVREHGYKVMYQPLSVVVHFEGKSHGNDVNTGIKRYQVENRNKFLTKWSDRLQREHYENGTHVFNARDRSRNKKTILIIDHYVPHYDRDAGSRTVFQYIKFFVNNGYNVKFVGDNYFKHEPYTTSIEQLGVEVLYGNWYASHFKDWLKVNGGHLDYILLNRPHISIKYIDMVKELTKAKVIYYGHDLHFLRESREYELTKNRAILENVAHWKKVEIELCNKADIVYYPSDVEISELRKQNIKTKAVAIPAYIFENYTREQFDFKGRKDLLFVGGFVHKPNVDAIVWFVEEIFQQIKERIPDLKLYVVGSNPPEQVRALQSESIIVTGFVSDEQLEQYYQSCRVVVVPLRYGAGVKGKVVEALYNQMPIVTTSTGAEGLPEAEKYMLIYDDTVSFAENTISLYQNEQLLRSYSEISADYVEEFFSDQAVRKVLAADFELGKE